MKRKDPGIFIVALAVIILVGVHIAQYRGVEIAPVTSMIIAGACFILLLIGLAIGSKYRNNNDKK